MEKPLVKRVPELQMLQSGHSMIYSIAAAFIATLGNDFEGIGQS